MRKRPRSASTASRASEDGVSALVESGGSTRSLEVS
jgi:hypothetical protein